MTLPKIPLPPAEPSKEGVGDVRGAYGYGRPAHGSDPQARYGFESNKPAAATIMAFVDDSAQEEETTKR